MTKVGIIGCGTISGIYLQAPEKFPILDIVACADIQMESARAKAEEYNIRAVSVDEILADPEIEIIINLTIPAAHAEVAIAALQAGKHVYSEKPLGLTTDEGQKILAAAKEANLRVGNAPDTFLGGGGSNLS